MIDYWLINLKKEKNCAHFFYCRLITVQVLNQKKKVFVFQIFLKIINTTFISEQEKKQKKKTHTHIHRINKDQGDLIDNKFQ